MKFDMNDDCECKACGCCVPLAEIEHPSAPRRGEMISICEVCYTTTCGNALLYGTDKSGVARMLCEIANHILLKLNKP